MVPEAGIEPARHIMAGDFKSPVSTVPPPGLLKDVWRRQPDLNRCRRLCRPLRNHSAMAPRLANSIYLFYFVQNFEALKNSKALGRITDALFYATASEEKVL